MWIDGYLSGVSGDKVLNWKNLENSAPIWPPTRPESPDGNGGNSGTDRLAVLKGRHQACNLVLNRLFIRWTWLRQKFGKFEVRIGMFPKVRVADNLSNTVIIQRYAEA